MPANTRSSRTQSALYATPQKSRRTRPRVQQQQQEEWKRPLNPNLYLSNAMYDHEILTKQEEQTLGRAVQRSHRLQKTLQELLDQTRAERALEVEELRQREALEFHDNDHPNSHDDDDDDDLIDLQHLSVYGMQAEADPEADPEDVLFPLDEDLASRSWPRSKSTYMKAYESRSILTAAQDWNDVNDNDDEDGLLFDLDWLSDEEIRQHMEGVSGRNELRQILLQGATARETLITSNLRLVVSIAKRWARVTAGSDQASLHGSYRASWDRPSVDEAIQEGILGLVKAVEKFNPERGLRFSTYATHWVTSLIRRCYQHGTTGTLRLPINYYETKSRFKGLVKQYCEMHGHQPTMEDLVDDMGLSLPRLKKIIKLTKPLLSIDAPLRRNSRAGQSGNDNGGSELLLSDTLVDTEPDPEHLVEISFLRQNLENAMATELAPHERDVVRMRLGLDDGVTRTCRQVSQEYYGGSLSVSEVRSAEKRALNKLRSPHSLSTYKLMAYLDVAGVDEESLR